MADKIQMKMKLLDTKVITGGVQIDRSKNLSAHYYEIVEGDDKGKNSDTKITYKKKQKLIMGKEVGIDFEKMLKERKPQGVNTGFNSGEASTNNEDEDISII